MADRPRVGVWVPNLLLRVPVDAAVGAAGGWPVAVGGAGEAVGQRCTVAVLDLEAAGALAPAAIAEMTRAGIVVLAFGPHVEADALAAARRAGAVALPRSAFLQRLPELLTTALATAGRR